MGNVAIISDIHGNMTALDAVLDYIQKRGINHIVCLGDLVGKGPRSAEAVDKIREVCDVVVQGNWDDFIQNPNDYPPILWHQNQLGPERFSYLSSLPFHLDFYMSGRYIRLFHASAKSIHHRVGPWHPDEEKIAMFDNTEMITPLEENKKPDIVGYGDIHAAVIEPVDSQKILFNAGSVGNPLDIPQATFAILHGEYHSIEPAPFSIEIVRVPYGIEEEIKMAHEMEMPDVNAYEIELRQAIYRGSISGKALLNVE